MTCNPEIDSRKRGGYNASRSVARGVTWAVLMRWVMRFIGLFSTLILARLLSPEDFGIVAMGMLVVQLLFEMSEFGASVNLIRSKEIDRSHCDTAWSINLLQGLLAALALVALAVPASVYFKEPQIIEVMYILALGTMIGGFENIGTVLIRRDLEFAKDFRFNVYKKLLTFCFTVGSAIILQNFWALLIGFLAGKGAGVVLSYLMHSYRPRWSLAHAADYVRFGMAMIPLRLASVLRGMIPSFLVAGLGNAAVLGGYRLAADLSGMFTREIVTPMGRGLLPNYARLADDPEGLSSIYKKMLGMVALVCIPIGVGVGTVADDLVFVLLGPQWGLAADLMPYLAIGATILAISQAMVGQVLVAMGRERSAALLAWLRLLITFPILWAGLKLGGVMGVAIGGIVAVVACLPLIYNEVRRAIKLPLPALLGPFWRPLLAALAMHLVIRLVPTAHFEWAIVRLSLDVLVGGSTFVAVILLLWIVSGRPSGPESLLLSLADKFLSKERSG